MERIDAASLRQKEQSYAGAIELFEMRCRSLNLSPETLIWYGNVLRGFAAFIEAHPDKPTPRHTKPLHVRAYLDNLRSKTTKIGRKVAPGSIRRFYVAIKTFFGFLHRERVVLASPFAFVEKPKGPKPLIRPLTAEQIGSLLAQFNTKPFTGLRDWTMTVLLLDSGLRLSEMLGIRNQDIHWGENTINVMGKGSRERAVSFGAKVKKALWDYKQRRGDLPGQDFFFVDHFGRVVKKRWYQQVLARRGKAANIEGVRVSPHTLRHSFACQYILNGGDAFSLQRLLGHSSMETVRIYVGLANRDVALQHRKYSPLDRMDSVPGAVMRVRLR